ncbi:MULTISPECIES: phosphatase PAP2 family protein [unclassified Sinorhizobium]|uniref:phosphatase PAP2 family protein n=1 Tax=unclassified Sinorhizobium TaxID=2613772 RepID=UPI003523F742
MTDPRSHKNRLTNWLNAYEPLTLAMFAALSGGLFLFRWLADEVLEGDTRRFDETILLSLREPGNLSQPIGPAWLTHAVNDTTSLGGVTVLTLMTVLVTLYLLLDRRRAIAIFMLLSVLGGWLVSTLLKLGVARPRPEIVPHLIEVHDLSFPSGHAMLSAVTYLTLGALLARAQIYRSTRIFVMAVAVFLTLIIGLSRIYLGVHFPTDVLGGWCAGATWALACWMVARRFIPVTPGTEVSDETPDR